MNTPRRTLSRFCFAALLTGSLLAGAATTANAQVATTQATVTLLNVAILPGQSFLGTIVAKNASNPVGSATVSGVCVTSGAITDTNPNTPGIQFTLPTLPSSAAGTCTLTFVVTFADNSTETDTANLVIAPNAASVGAVVTQTVGGLGTPPVDIQLFNCADVSNRNGVVTFRGTQPGGADNFAVPSTNGAVITAVNGAATNTTSNQANGVTPVDGSVTFTFTDNTAGECVIPVVFPQGTGTNADRLQLGADTHPVGVFATGTPTAFLPAPGPGGTIGTGLIPTALVIAVQPPYYVITSAGTFIQKDSDIINLYNSATGVCMLAPRIPGSGHRRLTPGDFFGGFYDPNGVSTFCLSDIAPAPPTTVTANQNTALGGATVTFTVATSTETTNGITSYNVYRAPATAPAGSGGAYTCPTSTPVPPGRSPQTPPPPSYTMLATVAASGAGTYRYNDTSASPGANASAPNAFCYAVSSVAINEDGGTQVGSARPADASNPPPFTSGTATAGAPAPEVGAMAASTTVVVSSTNPSGLGEAITLTATVTGPPGTPVTGTVQFRGDGVNLGPPVPLSGSTGSLTISDLGIGSHSITAVYSGSAMLAPSTSAPVAQGVNATITCDRTISGRNGRLVLGPGQWCIVDAQVLGLTVQPGAAVSITNSKIVGPVTSSGATLFRMCGSQVSRSLVVSGSTGFVLVGDTARGCARDDVAGAAIITANTAGVDVSNDRMSRSLLVNNNTGSGPTAADTATRIAANVIVGTLSCANNVPPPTNGGQPNTAGAKSGQCAAL